MSAAAAGSAVFFVAAPGVVAGVIPWALTRWELADAAAVWLPLRIVGGALVAAGAVALVANFTRFAREGRGTPAPVAPTENLVVGGWYRYVRNPMYVAVLAAIFGQALLFWRPVVAGYGAAVALAFVTFVTAYEEPTLLAEHGEQYAEYRRNVPGWWPRLRPWRPPTG